MNYDDSNLSARAWLGVRVFSDFGMYCGIMAGTVSFLSFLDVPYEIQRIAGYQCNSACAVTTCWSRLIHNELLSTCTFD